MCSSFGAAFLSPRDHDSELSMGCSTRQSNGENYLIDPALQLLDTAALPNETCALSTTYLLDAQEYKAKILKGCRKNGAVS
jgi:hypothetical protein